MVNAGIAEGGCSIRHAALSLTLRRQTDSLDRSNSREMQFQERCRARCRWYGCRVVAISREAAGVLTFGFGSGGKLPRTPVTDVTLPSLPDTLMINSIPRHSEPLSRPHTNTPVAVITRGLIPSPNSCHHLPRLTDVRQESYHSARDHHMKPKAPPGVQRCDRVWPVPTP